MRAANQLDNQKLGTIRDAADASGNEAVINDATNWKLRLPERNDAGVRWQGLNPIHQAPKRLVELEVLGASSL